MKLILRALLKTLSTKLLMEVAIFTIIRLSDKNLIQKEDVLRALGNKLDCNVTVKSV